MKIEQIVWNNSTGWKGDSPTKLANAQLVMVFGGRDAIERGIHQDELHELYPNAFVTGCSTAGEIFASAVMDDSLVATIVQFDDTVVRGYQAPLSKAEDSYSTGQSLAEQMETDGLVHVLVLSEGLTVNGSELVQGIHSKLPAHVKVTGGLSGDGDRFKETLIVSNSSAPKKQIVACIGFYGSHLQVGYGSYGGWDSFGADRLITRSEGNVLYELDGKSALDIYKNYLGDHASELPGSGLRFPLRIHLEGDSEGLVRTILAIDEAEGSLTFAGDIPQGAYARLMSANINRLVDGAGQAAKQCQDETDSQQPQLAILVSCVGRKMVLKQRVEEEIEAVQDVLGDETVLTGFYSYGEISPNLKCEFSSLHNQTMTITTFSES